MVPTRTALVLYNGRLEHSCLNSGGSYECVQGEVSDVLQSQQEIPFLQKEVLDEQRKPVVNRPGLTA